MENNHIEVVTALRGLHTLIYCVMALSTVVLLYVALTGHLLVALWVVAPLLAIETLVFTVSGLKCPVTALVDRYAGPAGPVSDTFFPQRVTRHTLTVFGPMLAIAFILLAARWAGLISEGPLP